MRQTEDEKCGFNQPGLAMEAWLWNPSCETYGSLAGDTSRDHPGGTQVTQEVPQGAAEVRLGFETKAKSSAPCQAQDSITGLGVAAIWASGISSQIIKSHNSMHRYS